MTTRKITLSAAALLMAAALAGCSGNTTSASSNSSSAAEAGSSAADTSAADSSAADSTASDSTASKLDTDITVVSREDGSGTRGAFVELMGIEQKNEAGEKEDMTRGDAEISNSTNGVMMSVAGNVDAIGYISLGSLNDTVKALDVNGVECSVADNGYIAIDSTGAYAPSGVTGAISLNGSTSVGPIMEKLCEAYKALNPDVSIDIQQTGSGAGITSATEGTCDIGMSSRELKQEELDAGLTEMKIADDGIAVIVNLENLIENITSDEVMKIYTGEITNWSELG